MKREISMKKFLVTGSLGQIGTELVEALKKQYGRDNVVASGVDDSANVKVDGAYEFLDVTDAKRYHEVVKKHDIDTVIHLAAILSAKGEENPHLLWDINMNGLYNTLEIAREEGLKVFTPSSIAAFGPSTPMDNTPQVTIQRPTSIYGVSKVAGELLCDYYYHKFGVDTRGVRYPGIISYKQLPGGGTTDYAVHIYFDALKKGKFICNLGPETKLDMMYMDDAVGCVLDLLEADPERLIDRNAFNVSAMSIDPEMMKKSIQKVIPDFTIEYDVNPVLQEIANSWPNSLDVSAAEAQWDFKPKYDLDKMTETMLKGIKETY